MITIKGRILHESPNFNSDLARRVTFCSAIVSTAFLLIGIWIMLTVDSAHTECPGWWVRSHNGSYTSIWFFVGWIGGMPCLALWLVFFRWKRMFAAKINRVFETHRVEGVPFPDALQAWSGVDPRTFPYTPVLVLPAIGFALFSGIPLLVMLGNCTRIWKY